MPGFLLLAAFGLLAFSVLRRSQAAAPGAGDIRVPGAELPPFLLEVFPEDADVPAGSVSAVLASTAGTWAQPGQNGRQGAVWAPPPRATPFLDDFRRSEAAYGLPPGLLARVAQAESSYNPLAVNRTSGASGLMQFMPWVANALNFDPFDPSAAIEHAGAELRRLGRKWKGNWRLALASYNWGEGNLARKGIARAPAETVNYVRAIAGDLGL